MKKPYFYVQAVMLTAFLMLMRTSFAQEVENQQQTNTTERVAGNVAATYGATGDPGPSGDVFYTNPFLEDILTSRSSGSESATTNSFHVDKSTGKVKVKVPIATVGPGDLKIPIELNYTTGGVKVGEVASWVGLGWDLSAGGKITRVMRRFPDKFDHSLDTLLNERTWKSRFYTGNEDNFDNRLKNADTQPDLFYFEIPGKSGMFAFDKNNKAHTIPYQNVKINYDISSETFEIIDDQGNRYMFNDMEQTRIREIVDIFEDEKDISYKSVWYLSSARNIKGESVSFEYKHLNSQRKYFYKTKDKSLKVRYYTSHGWTSSEADFTEYENYIDPLYLTKISWNDGHVRFISTADREDIPDQQAFKLMSIRLYAGTDAGTLLRSYNFEYDTFWNNNKALKLDGINVAAESHGNSEFYRKFDYFPITGIGSNDMVNKDQIDHWGYYNGPGSRTGIPRTEIYESTYDDIYKDPDDFDYSLHEWAGQDVRTPVLVHTLANSLQRIWSTSSGYDELEYELNTRRYYIPRNFRPDSVVVENVGGLRVKSITTKSTELSNAARKVRYEYAQDDCASSGVTFNDPHYYYFSSIENSDFYFTVTDFPIRPLFDLDGSHIRYGKVKEIFDNGSSNTYYYTTKADAPDKDYITYNLAKGHKIVTIPELSEKNMDFAPRNTQFWKRGLLTKKISLDASGNETRSETFQYNTNTNVKGRVKGFFPFTDKMYVYVNGTIPPGVPGVDYPGIPRVKWMFKNIYLAEYEYQSQPIYLKKQTVTGTDIPETVTEYIYDDEDGDNSDLDQVLLKKKIVTCDATTYATTYKYPLDYINIYGTEEGNAVRYMSENNLLSAPIEVVKYKNDRIVGGELYIYDKWHYFTNGSITGAMFNLREVKELLLKTPKSKNEFTESAYTRLSSDRSGFSYDNNYVTKARYEYNKSNRLSCIKERNKPAILFLYGDNPDLPEAQLSNAEAVKINGAYLEEAFYTSFEDNSGVANPRAKTGSKVLRGGYYTDMSILAPGSYDVSYWVSYNDGIDWELWEHEVEVMENDNRQFTIGRPDCIVDEYRIWKKGAQMQTKTYDKRLNVSSETDENGKTTYYDYDAFGRVILISDNERNKVKDYKYFIKN